MNDLKCRCGKKITKRENKLNAGLCNKCLQKALAAMARQIAKERE
jgi:hypothetical protein